MNDKAWNSISQIVKLASDSKNAAWLAFQDAFDGYHSYGTHTAAQLEAARVTQDETLDKWAAAKRLYWIRDQGVENVEAALAHVRRIIADSKG